MAGNYLHKSHGYISPAGVFLHPEDQLKHSVTVTLKPYSKWPQLIVTGLDSVAGKPYTYTATNYDILYDRPMLMGKPEQLPSFEVRKIPHYVIPNPNPLRTVILKSWR